MAQRHLPEGAEALGIVDSAAYLEILSKAKVVQQQISFVYFFNTLRFLVLPLASKAEWSCSRQMLIVDICLRKQFCPKLLILSKIIIWCIWSYSLNQFYQSIFSFSALVLVFMYFFSREWLDAIKMLSSQRKDIVGGTCMLHGNIWNGTKNLNKKQLDSNTTFKPYNLMKTLSNLKYHYINFHPALHYFVLKCLFLRLGRYLVLDHATYI